MRLLLILVAGSVLSWTSLAAAAAKPGPLKAGAATSNITPALGGSIVGGFKPYPATHIHDELHARCLVLDNGEKRLALVVCDLLGMHRSVSDEARRLIQAETGIPKENVLISATHTHSATTALGESRYQNEQSLDEYQQFVARRIADGVRRSVNLLRPAEIAFGTAEAPEHVFNRRWYMRPGTVPANPFGGTDLVKMNPPAGSPNLTEPAGPVDPIVSFLSVRELDGRPIALYAAYSLHYVGGVGPGHVSADYFALFCEELTRLQNLDHQRPPYVALLANSTSGDINNINFKTPRPGKPHYEQMQVVAHDVAAKVQAALKDLKYNKDVVLDARYREPQIASRKPTEDQLAWAKKTLAAAPADREKWDLSAIYADRTLHLSQAQETVPTPLQVLRIDSVAIGSMPAEVFVEIGLEFKDRSALKPAFLVSIAHGYFGYLPTPRHHDLGGYETWLGTNRLEREASVKMLNQLVEMTKELAE
ncbi:MAG: neutral/alkaline non-lysosomal ceramidase N-terminal domain-containing protein [Planctomycetota bacterium]